MGISVDVQLKNWAFKLVCNTAVSFSFTRPYHLYYPCSKFCRLIHLACILNYHQTTPLDNFDLSFLVPFTKFPDNFIPQNPSSIN